MDIERLFQELGKPGRFHVVVMVLVTLTWVTVCHNNVVGAFLGIEPVCLNGDVPESGNSSSFNGTECQREAINSIVTEWDLRGSRRYLKSLATSVYFAGIMSGGLVIGPIGDRFGRKPVTMASILLSSILGVVAYFMPYYAGFLVLRFFIGFFMQSLSSVAYVMVLEMLVGKSRTIAVLIFEIVWASGVMLMALFAYLLPNWRDLQLAIALPPLIAFAYFWWLPESPKWLNMRGRTEEVVTFFRRAARFNNVDISAALDKEIQSVSKESGAEEEDMTHKNYYFIHMLKTAELRKRSFILFYAWFLVSVNYYALTLQIGSLGGSRYMTFFIGGLLELFAYIAATGIMIKFGRKKPFIFYFFAAGIFCALAGGIGSLYKTGKGEVPDPRRAAAQQASSILAIIGRLMTASIFQIIFVWTTELYPTLLRSTALCFCNFFTRAGGLVAPQLLLLGDYTSGEVPLIIMGVLSIIAGCVSFLLPDTKDVQLPDTMTEAHNMKSTVYVEERKE